VRPGYALLPGILLLALVGCGSKSRESRISPVAPVSETTAAGAPLAVHHTDAEWRGLLSPDAYVVLRQAGTEVPDSSSLLAEHREGNFLCAGCGAKLFESSTKFESGTGWPSFWRATPGAVIETPVAGAQIEYAEIRCGRCGGHLGHVFHDGPRPTGLRYCMNGVALRFQPGG